MLTAPPSLLENSVLIHWQWRDLPIPQKSEEIRHIQVNMVIDCKKSSHPKLPPQVGERCHILSLAPFANVCSLTKVCLQLSGLLLTVPKYSRQCLLKVILWWWLPGGGPQLPGASAINGYDTYNCGASGSSSVCATTTWLKSLNFY